MSITIDALKTSIDKMTFETHGFILVVQTLILMILFTRLIGAKRWEKVLNTALLA